MRPEEMLKGEFNELLLDRTHFLMERVIVFDSIDEVLRHIIDNAVRLVRADAATLRAFNIFSGRLDIKASAGLSDSFLSQPSPGLGEGIAGTVVLGGEPFMTGDAAAEPISSNKELIRAEGIKALVSVPIKTRDTTIGCLTTYRKGGEPFTEIDMLLLNLFAAQSVDAIEKTKLVDDLKRQATYDHLTGVYNRAYFMKRLDEEIQRASRHNLRFTTIFIDLDDFKKFNDTNGHLLGDKLLADFSSILKKHVRKNDIIGRYGGEEFLIISPENDRRGSYSMAEKLLKITNRHSFMGRTGDVTGIGYSAGIALYPDDGTTVEEIIGRADEAMYAAKREGKNRVKIWGEA